MTRPYDFEPTGEYGSDRFGGADFSGPFAEGARDGTPSATNPHLAPGSQAPTMANPLFGEDPNPYQYAAHPYSNPGYGAPAHVPTPYDSAMGYMPGSGRELLPQAAAYGQINPALARPKSHAAAALLAFFLGSLGVHNFYLGYTSRGVIQLVIWLLSLLTVVVVIGFLGFMVVGIWAFIEFLLILFRSGSYGYDSRGIPLY